MTGSPARLAADPPHPKRGAGPGPAADPLGSNDGSCQHANSEADALAARLAAEMKPSGEMGRILIRRVATLSARLDRCGRHEAAMTARRVRDAQKDRDEARRAEVNVLAALLDTDPDRAVARMKEIPEGIDGLIEAWHVLRGRLDRPGKLAWNHHDDERLESLLGRHPGIYPPTPFTPILRAIQGDFSGLTADQRAGVDRKKRKRWALEQLAALIDAEVEALRELRVQVDGENEAIDRAEAADRALFDPSEEGQMARRYEAAAERGLFRALREFHAVEERAESVAATAPDTESPPRPAPAEPRPRPHAAAPAVPAPVPVAPPIAAAPPVLAPPHRTNPTPAARPSPSRGPG
ncbi:hypothetical protein TA3x_004962 [Tundrisphaera sp. TA3]|uniref:hypothetical protein n=1 Tax=Tundrisphaera sp. TA3 TaxID=3435775 RepID=UPI003EBBB6D1